MNVGVYPLEQLLVTSFIFTKREKGVSLEKQDIIESGGMGGGHF